MVFEAWKHEFYFCTAQRMTVKSNPVLCRLCKTVHTWWMHHFNQRFYQFKWQWTDFFSFPFEWPGKLYLLTSIMSAVAKVHSHPSLKFFLPDWKRDDFCKFFMHRSFNTSLVGAEGLWRAHSIRLTGVVATMCDCRKQLLKFRSIVILSILLIQQIFFRILK